MAYITEYDLTTPVVREDWNALVVTDEQRRPNSLTVRWRLARREAGEIVEVDSQRNETVLDTTDMGTALTQDGEALSPAIERIAGSGGLIPTLVASGAISGATVTTS